MVIRDGLDVLLNRGIASIELDRRVGDEGGRGGGGEGLM
jgi:hypothetical protein